MNRKKGQTKMRILRRFVSERTPNEKPIHTQSREIERDEKKVLKMSKWSEQNKKSG
jgi:hypothetical protein